jgi:S-DNA-T family DNA segregation ATPase FtsK/SpoIIIE
VTINGFHRPPADPADDLDVPDFMKPAGVTETIVGEVIPQPHGDEDDIAPGVVEYYTPRPPVLYRGASAAMVVASRTGRVVGLSARRACGLTYYFGHGAKAAGHLGYRYVRAHDLQEVIGGMSRGADWNKVEITRKKRWRTLGWLAAGTVATDLASWWALVKYAGLTAVDYSWAVAPGTEALAAGALLTLYGRYRLENKLAPQELIAAADADDGEEPFPLAWCTGGQQVEECLGRALTYEGIGTRRVDILGHRGWGWEVDIDLKGSTPDDVNKAADKLEAHMHLRSGGLLVETDASNRAHITLRLVTGDPFADMPKPTVHAPNSLSISDPHNFGRCMDGTALDVVLEGLRILVIGSSGSAKTTGVLRDLAEVITACHNAIALDLDPVKDGLREFEGVMAVPPIRGNKDCELWLGYLVKMAEARNVVRNRLKMGDTWVASREYPDIYPCVDEFIYLSQKAKELFIQLCRLGKQVGMFPIAAGQDATSDSLGDAVADSFTFRVMLASRFDDIRLVFGPGAGAAGFRPDRLEPAQNKDIKNDAGRSYIKGAGLVRALLYGWNEHSNGGIRRAVEERKAAGRPWFDYDTLAEAKLLHLADEYGPESMSGDGGLSLSDRLMLVDDARALKISALLGLFEEERSTFLPTALIIDEKIAADGAELQSLLADLVPGATASRQSWNNKPQVRGWMRSTVEAAANALLAPS